MTQAYLRIAKGSILFCAALTLAAGSLFAQGINVTTTSLPVGTLGLPYLTSSGGTFQLQASGGTPPYTWFEYAASGSPAQTGLPMGLTVNSNGTITGTPGATGTFTFTVQVNDQSEGFGQASLQMSVVPCSPTISSPASPLPTGEVGLVYKTQNFSVSGCPGYNYTYSVQPIDPFNPNTLPPGLSMSTAGMFEGTPTAAGTYNFYVTLTDQYQNTTQFQYQVTVVTQPSFTTISPLPNGPVGVPYSQQIVATGGLPPYTFSMNANPPGITITQGGLLQGTPTSAGTFKFNIGVYDSFGQADEVVDPFQVTFATAVSQIQVTPLSLTFSGNAGGDPPPTLGVSLVPVSGATLPVTFKVVVDNGQNGGAQPSWITVTPVTGNVPAGLVVSVDQGSLSAGTYPARIQVIDANGFANDVAVTLNVASVPQQLNAAPTILNFSAKSSTPGILVEQIAVTSSGISSLPFTTSVLNNSSWISSVTAGASATSRNAPVFVQVQVNTSGLQVGAYNDTVVLTSSAETVQIPVNLFVAASGSILGVDTTGVLFQAIQGGGSTQTQIVKILNLGDSSSTVNWTASLVNPSNSSTTPNWLSLVSPSGTATSATPGTLTLALSSNATQLTAGPYYAIVQIADSNSHNSPQYVAAVLNLEPSTASPAPYLGPAGLFFTTPAGGSAPSAQQVQINTSSASSVSFAAAATTLNGGSWLTVTPTSGNASGATAGSVVVSVNPTGLAAGIYSGNVNISIGSLLQSVNVTFVVQGTASESSARPAREGEKPEAAGCSANQLAITETGLVNNFAIPSGWPATLIVQLNDNCGAPVIGGNVVASFSNGDAPLNLKGDSLGNYSSTWQPGTTNSTMVVTLNAVAANLQSAVAKLYGGIAANQTPPPTLAPGGTINNLYPGAVGLSPGTIAAVYGSGLAASAQSTGMLPLPNNFNNTFALIGSTKAPLYFLSNGQINLEVPFETQSTQQVPIMLSVNNALTLPQMISIVPQAPGVAAFANGNIIAQHLDYSLVTSTNPGKPGEYLIMYLSGMGATNPPVASGAVSPSTQLANVTVQPTVTVGSQASNVVFAGLTPGSVGLYQIDFQVPAGASSGNLNVVVTQNGVPANTTVLPVSN